MAFNIGAVGSPNIGAVQNTYSGGATDYEVTGSVSAEGGISSQVSIAYSHSGQTSAEGGISSQVSIGYATSGRVNAASEIGSTVAAPWDISGNIAAASEISSTVETSGGISMTGSIVGAASVGGTVRVDYIINGRVNAASETSSQVGIDYRPSGRVNGTSEILSTTVLQFSLTGTTAAEGGISSSVRIDRTISGRVNAASEISSSVILPQVYEVTGSVIARSEIGYIDGNTVANVKRLLVKYSTGATVYAIVKRLEDGYLLDDFTGNFALSPADPYRSLSEDTVLKGIYSTTEARSEWDDGDYVIAYYSTSGSPNPSVDTNISPVDPIRHVRSDTLLDDGVISDRIMKTLLPLGLKILKDIDTLSKDPTMKKKYEEIRVGIAELQRLNRK